MFMVKGTSVFSAIALAGLMCAAGGLAGLCYRTGGSLLLLSDACLVVFQPVSAEDFSGTARCRARGPHLPQVLKRGRPDPFRAHFFPRNKKNAKKDVFFEKKASGV